jgi:hypothetical protein
MEDAVRRLSLPTYAGTTREKTSLLPQRAHQLIAQRLDEVGQAAARSAAAGRADRGIDDFPNNASADGNAKFRKQKARDQRAGYFKATV